MFEEVCLVCGKHLQDDGLAYCSEDCQSIDLASPSISSSSSALSSPHLGYTAGGDVPALIPSALGSALKEYRGRGHYSSSSASSTSWSVATDDEDDAIGAHSEYSFHDGDSIYEGSFKSAGCGYPMRPSALSYARRPSGTNNGSNYSNNGDRHASSGSSGHVRGYPRSAPIHSHSSTEDDDSCSDFGFSSRDPFDGEESDLPSPQEVQHAIPKSSTTKAKRSRNRASLPAYFSLLQITSPAAEARSSPMSSSSAQTVARPSPPTPKLVHAHGLNHSIDAMTIHVTSRGRRRVPGDSMSSHRSGHSSSHSRSRSRHVYVGHSPNVTERLRARLDSKGSMEKVFDWSSVPGLPVRGRTAIRRNSSPPPKMAMIAMEDGRSLALAAARNAEVMERSSSRPQARGRARAEELDGRGVSREAPGYGHGRSGLVNRERERAMGVHSVRVPL
ncbi:hypothetical protein BDQ12DRAFT_719228 [Crucibulum laeve]|uniref:Uncharacterized protein n=1 Tax=Crucibulum laeve TaxID=68775 RepID=A0A5C3MEP1_9AGAR|nr:hypothetical protein BDQ12DRAFT_719228 [Crucibulum laeve]